MSQKRWAAVQVRYPRDAWETGADEFRILVSERGGRFLPETSNSGDVVIALYSEHEASTAAEVAMRAIEAVQADGLAAGIGSPTSLDVGSHDGPPSGPFHTYARRS
jgi:hypothetical protein